MFKKVNNTVKSYMNYVRNAIIIFSVFITIFYAFLYFMNKDSIQVDESGYEKSRREIYEFIQKPEFQKDDFHKTQIAIYRSFLCITLGETCTENPEEADQYINNSLVTKASNTFVIPYTNPPASGIAWAYESIQQSGFVPQTYAQGVGFYALQPLAPIWKVFRNVAYMVLVFIVVTIGFMVMFRANINPQAVMTIESAIPRIVLTLILITFSFPIAGFLIDVMYILMGLGGSVVVNNLASNLGYDGTDSITVAQQLGWGQDIFNSNGWDLLGRIVGHPNVWRTGPAILSLVPFELQLLFRTLIGGIVFLVISWHPQANGFITGKILEPIPVVGGFLSVGLGAVISFILFGILAGLLVPVILSFFVFVTSLFLFFKIFFLLFMTYTKILLSIIFAPIILIFEAFPERGTFTYWIKGLFFNLLVFPIVAILLLTAGMIANISQTGVWYANPTAMHLPNTATGSELWRPPFLYSIEPEGFVMLIAISIIFLIPDMIEFVKKSFGVEDLPFNITPGKLLGGAGIATAGGVGLFLRARSLASEFGIHKDHPNIKKFGLGFINNLLSDNPNDVIANAVKRQAEQVPQAT